MAKLDYNQQLGTHKICCYNREFAITGMGHVLCMDLGQKNLFVITRSSF